MAGFTKAISIIGASLFLAICLLAQGDKSHEAGPLALPSPRSQGTIRLYEGELQQQDSWWHIRIKYPVIEGNDGFNASVRRHVTTTAEEFRKGLPRTASNDYPDYGAYLEGSYKAQVLKDGIVSVLFDYSEYTPGAVHPWGVLASINYDTRTRRVLSLSDLFRPGSHYVSRLSQLSIEELDQRHGLDGEEAIHQGAGPVEKNFQVFTLTDNELVLHFQQYQVAPGVVPAQDVVIPFTKIQPLLRR